jgi:hypothetical protein
MVVEHVERVPDDGRRETVVTTANALGDVVAAIIVAVIIVAVAVIVVVIVIAIAIVVDHVVEKAAGAGQDRKFLVVTLFARTARLRAIDDRKRRAHQVAKLAPVVKPLEHFRRVVEGVRVFERGRSERGPGAVADAVNSTPNEGATAWIAANWAGPADIEGSRMTATRFMPGTTSLISSSHFPLMLYSNTENPGSVAAWPRQALDKAGANPIGDLHEYDRHCAGRL